MDVYEVILMNKVVFRSSKIDACKAFIDSVRSGMDGEYFGLPAEDAAYSCVIIKR